MSDQEAVEEIIKNAPIRYTSDSKPGITRRRQGKNFIYFDSAGKRLTDTHTLERIEKLVIPPAWENVWISPSENTHLQATGFDEKGRKQYRYHELWNESAQAYKFEHMLEFSQVLPKIRRKVREHMTIPGLPREKILATVVWLLENTLIRIGNVEYEKENKSHGLTTLKNRHVDIHGERIRFQFMGKSGVPHNVSIKNKRVAKILKYCQELPGQHLFEYYDEEKNLQKIDSDDVNDYLKLLTDRDITAKDFRTWGGTNVCAELLDKCGVCEDEKMAKKNITNVVKKVAQHLRNKPSTCRKYYIHPKVIEAYREGYILSNVKNHKKHKVSYSKELDESENRVICMLNIFA